MRQGRASRSLARGDSAAGTTMCGRRPPITIFRSPWPALLLIALCSGIVGGCGLFGSDSPPPQAAAAPSGEAVAAGAEWGVPPAPSGPFAQGVLKEAAHRAPPGSTSQFLATIADEMEWESDVSQDLVLRQSISEGQFDERVEARLLGLFFRKGFSILPSVGEGHEFTRDSIVRGAAANRRFFARSREPVRILFLDQVDNVVIIYPKNAEQPQVFNRVAASTVALRESRLDQYLN